MENKIPQEVYEDAFNKFNLKIAMPQYESYLNDAGLLKALMQDCIAECEFAYVVRNARNRSGKEYNIDRLCHTD